MEQAWDPGKGSTISVLPMTPKFNNPRNPQLIGQLHPKSTVGDTWKDEAKLLSWTTKPSLILTHRMGIDSRLSTVGSEPLCAHPQPSILGKPEHLPPGGRYSPRHTLAAQSPWPDRGSSPAATGRHWDV